MLKDPVSQESKQGQGIAGPSSMSSGPYLERREGWGLA